MTVDEAVEQAARRAFENVAGGAGRLVPYDTLLEIQKDAWRDGARAAIVRFLQCVEPSVNMLVAGNDVIAPIELKHCVSIGGEVPDEIWRAMARKLAEEMG